MKIVIIGPGAMGCLFAGLLTQGGHEVHLLDKRLDRAQHISRQGLMIDDLRGTRTIPVGATARTEGLKDADIIIICVKAYDTASTIPELLTLISNRSLVLTLQNGLGNVELLAAHVSPLQILAGVTEHGSTLLGVGHVRHAGDGPTTLGALRPEQHEQAIKLASVFSQTGIKTTATPDMTAMLWSKLIINAAIGPLSALSGLSNGQLLEQAQWRSLLDQAAAESAAVSAHKGIQLLYNDPIRAVADVCRNTAKNYSSMLQDIRHGRQTEIVAINGAIVREAAAMGITAPVNEDLIRRIRVLGHNP